MCRQTRNEPESGRIRFYAINGNSRDGMGAALGSKADIDGKRGQWAGRQLLDLLRLEVCDMQLLAGKIVGDGAMTDLPVDPLGSSKEWYALIRSEGSAAGTKFLARFPRHWRPENHPDPQALRLVATPDSGGKLAVQIGVPDERLQAVLNFMQQTDLEAALSLLETSTRLLHFTHDNPYAAAAAGYVLLAAPAERMPRDYFDWICKLGKQFDEIPDACIQHAALLLQTALPPGLAERDFPTKPEQRCTLACDLLLESLRRGLPLYRSAFKLLVSNFRILENDPALAPERRREVSLALHLVNPLRLRLDINQPFTIIDVSDLDVVR